MTLDSGPTPSEPSGQSGVRTVSDPDATTAADVLDDARRSGAYATVVGECTVAYDGTTSSTHALACRHGTFKPDGTVLVHDASGHRPVHPQPSSDRVVVEATDDGDLRVLLGDGRVGGDDAEGIEDGSECLRVTWTSLDLVSVLAVDDPDAATESGTEADLKSLVLDDPDRVEPGLVPLATERRTRAGPVDVYAEDATGRPVVLELKRDRAGPDAVGQLDRYVEALARDSHADADPRGVLVAPGLTDRARQLLAERGLEFARVDPRDSAESSDISTHAFDG
ncbi:DUF91 domain-containing protein [Halorubellus sp. JP-L1]|uniref:endonuclease NucS n=1 Tax=Halorubellus sp. JP-L1 TaxID=2715753 RepID=UPI00140BFB95|nr:DUF91 domain-containing protein [Halorubellus sp. JP-L1]